MLSLGIVGLPNVGKSTLFNALTGSKQAEAQNYPFCTIEPNVGVIEVPDKRLNKIAAVSKSKKIIPTAIEFVDIAGLVKGAAEGEGLGNKFLSHIREVEAIIHVVRFFSDTNVTHVSSKINPKDDVDIINLELIMADWQIVSKRLEKVKKQAKGVILKELKKELDLLEKLSSHLKIGRQARELDLDREERKILRQLCLLTAKPMLYVVNIDDFSEKKEIASVEADVSQVEICAQLESELSQLDPDEAKEYMNEIGLKTSGLDKIIVAGYNLLNLKTFFTSGEPETRAWTIKKGTKGPDAAGVIHTDFIKGYIKADVVKWNDFVNCNGWVGAKEKGKIKLEGKDYEVKDGDVCFFHVAN